MIPTKKWVRRVYEVTALVAVRKVRTIALFWARQCRKSTTLGSIAFDEMSREPGRNVIAASASLLIGSELVSKTISAADQALIVTKEAAAMQNAMAHSAAENDKVELKVANSDTGKEYKGLTSEDYADLYRSGRLEMRLYHTRTIYSRLQVIAPNPATARGWTGTVMRDESGFTPVNLETELQGAVGPIIDADPTFKMIYASNLPRDDRHPYFEMTLPPPDMEFPAKKEGHFYRGQNGILIHRVSLADAYAAGHVLYDSNSGKPLTLDQFRKKPGNKLYLPFNYDLLHQSSGTSAIDLFSLLTSMKRGSLKGAFIFVDNDLDFLHGLQMLQALLGTGTVGLGFDVATTNNETSNPSSITVTEKVGVERIKRAVFVWKEKKEQIARDRLFRIIDTVSKRRRGGPARRLCMDASNEKYFAEGTAALLSGIIPVDLIVSGSSVLPPGYKEETNMKTYLGDLYSAAVNDNLYSMPSSEYLKEDQRLVCKDKGRYVCVPTPDGKHGDTFDSGKLAEYALEGKGNEFAYSSVEPKGRSRLAAGRGTGVLL